MKLDQIHASFTLSFALVLLAACGVKGPPLPPESEPTRQSQVKAEDTAEIAQPTETLPSTSTPKEAPTTKKAKKKKGT